MFQNKQLPSKQTSDPNILRVFKIFETIQGEGPLTGRTCIFIRTHGCNLQCPQCDTDYTSSMDTYTAQELFDKVHRLRPKNKKYSLIVFTGGEPLRQNLSLVSRMFLRAGYYIQFETNGMMWQLDMEAILTRNDVTVVCSPKTPKIHERMERCIDHFKYIGAAGQLSDDDGLPNMGLGYPLPPKRPSLFYSNHKRHRIWLSAMDQLDAVKNKNNMQACLASCLKYGYSFTHQLHKIVGVE